MGGNLENQIFFSECQHHFILGVDFWLNDLFKNKSGMRKMSHVTKVRNKVIKTYCNYKSFDWNISKEKGPPKLTACLKRLKQLFLL